MKTTSPKPAAAVKQATPNAGRPKSKTSTVKAPPPGIGKSDAMAKTKEDAKSSISKPSSGTPWLKSANNDSTIKYPSSTSEVTWETLANINEAFLRRMSWKCGPAELKCYVVQYHEEPECSTSALATCSFVDEREAWEAFFQSSVIMLVEIFVQARNGFNDIMPQWMRPDVEDHCFSSLDKLEGMVIPWRKKLEALSEQQAELTGIDQ